MKKLFTLICLLALAAGTAFAQKMIIKLADGEPVIYSIPKIEYIMFEEDTPVVEDFVDLGLPSGTLWASCNIGANSPEDYGDYFAWGETETKDEYSWATYSLSGGSSSTITKYCSADNQMVLLPEDDAARANLGDGWQMPTLEQSEELFNTSYTSTEWTQMNGVDGMKITSISNGKSIFLPAAGYRKDTDLNSVGGMGTYWTTSRADYAMHAYEIYVSSGGFSKYMADRSWGHTIRPVVHEEGVRVEQISLSATSLVLLVGGSKRLKATVLPDGADNKTLYWESSNTAVATVSVGLVTAVGEGTCTITCRATDGSGVKAECQVTVFKSGGPLCPDNQHPHIVDLGLPSGTKWSCYS